MTKTKLFLRSLIISATTVGGGFVIISVVRALYVEKLKLLTEEEMGKILQKKAKEKKVVLKQTRLQEYFPSAFTEKQMEEVILQLLKDWRREHGEL